MSKCQASLYRGVTWSRRHSKWLAGISLHGKYFYLGAFEKEHEAARTWDVAALKSRGIKTKINFQLENYLNSSGNLMVHTKLDSILNGHRAKRVLEESSMGSVSHITDAGSDMSPRHCNKRCRPSSSKASSNSSGLCWSPTDSIATATNCTRSKDSSAALAAVGATGAAANPENVALVYQQDVWSTQYTSSTQGVTAARHGSTDLTMDSLTRATSCANSAAGTPHNSSSSLGKDTAGDLQQHLQQLDAFFGMQHQQQQQELLLQISSNEEDKLLSEVLSFLEPASMQPPPQQQSSSLLPPMLPLNVVSCSNSVASVVTNEPTLPWQQQLCSGELQLPSLTGGGGLCNGSGCYPGPCLLKQLYDLAPNHVVYEILPRSSNVVGALCLAATTAGAVASADGLRGLPWRVAVWDANTWQHVGDYAQQQDAEHACMYVLSLLVGRWC